MKKILIIILTACVLLSSCATIIIPHKQKITINTKNPNCTVFIDKVEVGKGESVSIVVKKKGAKQVAIQAPNFKDEYYVLQPNRRSPGYYWLQVLNVSTLFIGCWLDKDVCKNLSYDKVNDIPCVNKLETKPDENKYIDLSSLKIDLKDQSETPSFASKLNVNNINENELADYLYTDLKKSNYIDSVYNMFPNHNNTLVIDASITDYSDYICNSDVFSYGNSWNSPDERYASSKVYTLWVLKNIYGEILDSINFIENSGQFILVKGKRPAQNKLLVDAIDNSFFKLFNDSIFRSHLKVDTSTIYTKPRLTIQKPDSIVKSIIDAISATVIVKNNKKLGSGFAISLDGYIITNYHVISGTYYNKFNDIKVILSNGEEVPARIERYNRYRDLALLKIDRKFNKSFILPDKKSFKPFQEAYTIGSPATIELGQSITKGVISNERNFNGIKMLQLDMNTNFGNNGGPLLDKNGNLHGVIFFKLFGYATEGIGFAIPAHLISDYLNIYYN